MTMSMTKKETGVHERSALTAVSVLTAQDRRLIGCGAAGGLVFVLTALIEGATRSGYSLTRDALSVLELGSWGWVQEVNFLVTGALLVGAAIGLRKAWRGEPGGRWAWRFIAIAGIGTAAAGVFHPDPSNGFPPGTSLHASTVSGHGATHLIVSSAAFLAMIAFCVVTGRRAASRGQLGLQRTSYAVAGVSAVTIFIGVSAKTGPPLTVGVSLALLWVTASCVQILKRAPVDTSSEDLRTADAWVERR